MSQCICCGNLRTFAERDRDELQAMHNDLLQTVAKIKAHIHVGHGRAAFYRFLEGLERDIRATRDRVDQDGAEPPDIDVPY